MFGSFKTKLVLLMLLLSIIPMLLGGAISYTIISQTLTRDAKDKLGNIPAPAARRLETLLYSHWNHIQITSHIPLFKESKDYLSRIKYFILQKALYSSYSWLGATDANGNIIASSDIYDTGKSRDMSSADWFLQARGISFQAWMTPDQGVVVRDAFISELSGGIPVVSLTAPIYNFYGEFVGAVHSEIDMSFVAQNIENLRVGETGSAVLVKRDGVIIADKNGAVRELNRNIGDLNAFNEAQAGKSGVLREKVDLHLLSGRRKDPNEKTAMPGKEDSFIGYAPLRGYEHCPSLGWAILVVQSADEIYAGAKTHALFYGFMFALGVVAVGLGSYFSAKKVTTPIKKLSEAAKTIGGGALDFQIKDRSKDEVGELAKSFNQMARSLKESRNELRLERDKLDAIISSMGAGLAIIDRDLKIEFMNKTFLDNFGSDSLGKMCFCIIAGRDEMCANCPLVKPMDLMCSEPVEVKAANGNTFLVTHAPLRNPDGTFSAVLVLKNITEMKKLQTQLEEKNSTLEEAYKHLKETQAQLIQAGKLAAIGELAGGVAHEINNPLSGVLGYAKRLLKKTEAEELKNVEAFKQFPAELKIIAESAMRCKGITDSLLRFARPSEAKSAVVNVNDVIMDALTLISHRLSLEGIDVAKRLQPALKPVLASHTQLQQVFINFVINAAHAMPQGGELSITTRQGDGEFVQIEFTDTGVGIPKEDIPRIFDPFFTTKEPGTGTGLGLSISYRIIKDHDGTIDVKSRVGKGTTFTIALPVYNRQ